MEAGAGFGAPSEGEHPDPTDLGDAEAEGGGLGVGLAGIDHHQALVLGERQVPPSGNMPDTKRLAPAEVAPTPAAKGEGAGGSEDPPVLPWTPQSWSKPPAFFQGDPNLPCGPQIFLRTP